MNFTRKRIIFKTRFSWPDLPDALPAVLSLDWNHRTKSCKGFKPKCYKMVKKYLTTYNRNLKGTRDDRKTKFFTDFFFFYMCRLFSKYINVRQHTVLRTTRGGFPSLKFFQCNIT